MALSPFGGGRGQSLSRPGYKSSFSSQPEEDTDNTVMHYEDGTF